MRSFYLKFFTTFCLLCCCISGIGQAPQGADTVSARAVVDTLNSKGAKSIRYDASKALLLFMRAEQMARANLYREGLAASYVNQAEVFSARGYSNRALLLYYKALSLSNQYHDQYNAALCEQHISTVKRKLKRYKEATTLLNHALLIFIRLHKSVDVVNVQLRLGLVAQMQKQYPKALQLYNAAYSNSIKAKYSYGEKKSYYNKGLLYRDLNDFTVALTWFHCALRIDTATKDNYGKALSYLEIAKIYDKQQSYKQAEQYAHTAYLNADSVHGNDLTKEAATLLVSVNRRMGNLAEVVNWQDKLLTITNSLTDQEKQEAVTFVDFFKREQENQQRYITQIERMRKVSEEKTNLIRIFLIVLGLCIAMGVPLHFSYRRAKAYAEKLVEKNEQIEEKSAAVEQLNSQITLQNKELEQDNSLKNKLLSVISHDLRHPLVNTRSLLDIYNQELLSQEEAKTLFGQLEAQYIRTITLLDNLLFWIKRQVQHADAVKSKNAVAHLVNELIEEQKLALNNKNIRVSNNIDPSIQWVTDREALRIVFRNLLNNALKFTPDKGTINFSSSCADGLTGVSVTDSGIGMGSSKLKKVIAGSYMTTNGTAGEIGSGFGLLLVRDLISKDGGTLDIESSPGAGSCFTIRFPQTADMRARMSA